MEFLNIDQVVGQSREAFDEYKSFSATRRAKFLRCVGDELMAKENAICETAQRETSLPEMRIKGELGRTIGQLKAFAALLDAGHWVQATIDTGDPNRKPIPKPDIRKMLFPIGPIVVFGASNFPLAFSTAGGDTASALAAGCSVIVKSHPAHPQTSKLVAEAIKTAIKSNDFPPFVFQHIEDSSIEVGQHLVKHPSIKGVAFTGSFKGGKALYDLANQRTEPIPVFAEMGSINPVILLPKYLEEKVDLVDVLSASILQGVGQFCTNPGLIVTVNSNGVENFVERLSNKMASAAPAKMLHPGIAKNFRNGKTNIFKQDGVEAVVMVEEADDDISGSPSVGRVRATHFIANPHLHEEVFGPFALIVICDDFDQIHAVIESLKGQLTASIFGLKSELEECSEVVKKLVDRCGRVIFNGVPTGVEVCKAMHHGGPFPASTDSRFTSVGSDAIYRFVRPISFQSWPNELLPAELRDDNPSKILRCVNNEWTTSPVIS